MNKNIKKIIATTIAISAFSTIVPAKYLNATTVVANAAEYGLSSLKLNKSSGSSITLYKDRSYDESVTFKGSRDSYYATTNTSKVSVKFNAEDGYEAKAFLGSDTDAYDSGDDIKLDSGSNTIYIRTYKEGEFDSSNIKDNVEETYKISVRKESTSSSSKDDDDFDYQDEIYLDELKLSEGSFNFVVDKASYDVSVDEDVKEVTVTAKPKKTSHTVKINGSIVDSNDDYKKTVALDNGKNKITIKLSDDDGNERTYTFNITRGDETTTDNTNNSYNTSSSTDSINSYLNSSTSNINTQTSKTPNTWIKDALGWKRTDANGDTLRDTWYLEQATGKYYYLKFNGYMTTDWRFINGEWYYFNEQGEMQTGWIQGKSGEWYYLNPTGEMAKNTVIDGYKLGVNGALIK